MLQDDLIIVYEILDFTGGERFYYIKIRATLIDGSELHIREFYSSDKVLYSYHWQDENGSLRMRWDNAPHHSHLSTYPYHKHAPELEDSEEMCLEEVLKEIRESV